MCGRFTNRLTWREIAALYGLTQPKADIPAFGLIQHLATPSAAFVHKTHWVGATHVTSFETLEPKASIRDKNFDRSVKMTTATYAFPNWRKTVLPPTYIRLGSTSVFHK
jgi:hypothetical protein